MACGLSGMGLAPGSRVIPGRDQVRSAEERTRSLGEFVARAPPSCPGPGRSADQAISPTESAEAQEARAAQVERPPSLLAEALVPSTKAVRRAQVRIDQRIALLRHV